MAYDRENDTLKVTSESGISLQEVSLCLRDYRLDTNGRIDLGMMCTSPNIKLDALFRPHHIEQPFVENFDNGGTDGLHGFVVPMTENDTVYNLWRETWLLKPLPSLWYNLSMFNNYWHKASYDEHPFGIRKTQAGSNWSFEYFFDANAPLSVCPSFMGKLRTFYPAFQVFEEEYGGHPQTLPIYNWCGSRTVGEGVSGELVSISLEEGKTYYIIPFLSQYKFTSQAGYMGRLAGEKYCLIYKNWNINDWIIKVGGGVVRPVIRIYISLLSESTYSLTATFRYDFDSDAFVAPSYWYEVYNTSGQKVYTSTVASITSSFQGTAGESYSWSVSISKVNPNTGSVWPSGYIIRVWHKEQTSATGTTQEFSEDYIMP